MGNKSRRIKIFGGLVFAGLLLVQVSAAPFGGRDTKAGNLSPVLWETTGMVRQSIVDLYRARRLLVQATLPANDAAAGTAAKAPAPAAKTPAAPAGPAAKALAPAANPTANSGPTRSLPQPSAPPAPNNAGAAFDPGKTIDTNLEMRVAVAKNASSLEVATSVDGYLMDINGQNHCNLPAQSSLVLKPQGSGMAVGDCTLGNTAWLEPGEGGYVFVGDSWYKGRVLMITDGSGLMAVNFVLMHDYLSSVVGSEMYVGWPAEALKAQAVAARSYALVHHVRHAQRAYDLDNTQRYQAYKGIAKETNTTQAAVADTTGEFISYNGGIVESLYAASDAIVQAAHGGNGMSQTGAMELASKGYNYTQILGNYYPGTSLSRLVVE
ncbi:SpoIID/LytB domain-containing protein [Nodosilinea sp. FACHB-13]|uniref:SpoIID/LytB domain-containing protein n=1 Tax=Cyanophyceae TaxID=3028117 RepID=UPI001F548C35|nr:SpoIID/LytB domain-containing protein [Nodosilinea sp. FACHB-13]